LWAVPIYSAKRLNFRETLTGNLPRARQQLKQILSGPLSAAPQPGADGLSWDFRGLVSLQGWHFDLATVKGTQNGQVERTPGGWPGCPGACVLGCAYWGRNRRTQGWYEEKIAGRRGGRA
jgi:hypothetical protein